MARVGCAAMGANWWRLVCLLLTLAGQLSAAKSCRSKVTRCMNQDYDTALYNNDQVTLCRLTPVLLKCMDDVEESCGSLGKVFEDAKERMETSYARRCTEGQVRPSKEKPADFECLEEMKKCLTTELQRANQEKDVKKLCEISPQAIECMKRSQQQCSSGDPLEDKLIEGLEDRVTEICANNNSGAILRLSPLILLCLVAVVLDRLTHALC